MPQRHRALNLMVATTCFGIPAKGSRDQSPSNTEISILSRPLQRRKRGAVHVRDTTKVTRSGIQAGWLLMR